MTDYVYVVTHLEMGWDCVCGVYKTNLGALRHVFCDPEHREMTEEELETLYEEDDNSCYIIHSNRLGE